MPKITPTYGVTFNDIPFARFGSGEKKLLLWSGGPGNNIQKGFGFNLFASGLTPFLDEYTMTLLTRRSGLNEGCTTRDMSNDYADLIHAEFAGHVHLIVGMSYGGIVAQHFAADHPDLCDQIVFFMAAYKINESGRQLDYRFAELLSQNKPRQAYALIAEALISSPLALVLMRPLLWLLGPSMLGDANTETFRRDVLIEAQAELNHDALESLARITIPVLVQGGDRDKYFPLQYFQETAEMIPGATLKIYPGKGHNLLNDELPARDILDWVSQAQ